MRNITSVHMQACKVGSSETHNLREKQLSYVVPEMSHLNESVIHERIPKALARIEATYTEVTGQRMQPTASPLKEAVLVIREDTTMEQVEKFGELCRQELGITPIQFHIHRDEGHYDSATKEWKPNLHAHIVFDCSCRDHRLVERPAKSSKEMKSKNGKPPTKLIDNYGKIVRLSKADMSRMQDLASIATGMERGAASDKVHLDAQRYKAQVIAEEVKSLEQTRDNLGHTVLSLEGDIAAKEKEMKRIDVLSSFKKTITSVFDKAADDIGVSDRVKALEQQVADGQARLDAVTKDSYTKAEVSRMLEEKDNVLQRYKTTVDQTLNRMQKEINHLKSENRRLLTSIYNAAKILLTRFTSEAISIFEKVGLPGVLGQRIWDRVKEYEAPREDLGQKNGRGMKM